MQTHSKKWTVLCMALVVGCNSRFDIPVVAPAPPNDFVTQVNIEHVFDANTVSAISDETEIIINTGVLIQFEFTPAAQYPEVSGNREVLLPMHWPADIVIFPRGDSSISKSAMNGNCAIFPIIQKYPLPPLYSRNPGPSKGHADIMINSFHSAFWYECGFQHTKHVLIKPASPESQARMKKDKNPWFWTYLCAPKDQIGEFVYEIRVFPTAAWISTVRYEMGEPVVLKRGLLRVKPAE